MFLYEKYKDEGILCVFLEFLLLLLLLKVCWKQCKWYFSAFFYSENAVHKEKDRAKMKKTEFLISCCCMLRIPLLLFSTLSVRLKFYVRLHELNFNYQKNADSFDDVTNVEKMENIRPTL